MSSKDVQPLNLDASLTATRNNKELADAEPEYGDSVKTKNGRVLPLQGIRFFIQNWIIIGHYIENRMYNPLYSPSFDMAGNAWFAFLGRAGSGVTFYIVASGVLTYVGFRNTPLPEYFVRRLTPIWVINVLAIYIPIWVLGEEFWNDGMGTSGAWKTTFFLDTVRHSDMKPTVTGTDYLWTLSTLAFCWLAFPFLNVIVKNTSTNQRWLVLMVFLIVGGWPWVYYGNDHDWITGTKVETFEGDYWDVRARPWFRIWDFSAGVIVGSWIKEGYLLDMEYSWLWVYIADAALAINVIILATMSCNEGDYNPWQCRDVSGYWLMEGPIGCWLWLIYIYGQFWEPSKMWGISRRIAGDPVAVAISAGGTTFIAYVGQGTVDSLIYSYDPETYTLQSKPYAYDFFMLICLWTFAVIINRLVYVPVSTRLKTFFKHRNLQSAQVHQTLLDDNSSTKAGYSGTEIHSEEP